MMHTKQFYDPVARSFHGIMAVLIVALLAIGLYMADLDPSPDKWKMYNIHKATGMIVLALVALRLWWRMTHIFPAPSTAHPKWERTLARLVHFLLYFAMIVMPISGYVMSSAGGHPISIFGWFNIPLFIDKNPELGEVAEECHELGGTALMGALGLHIIGSLKHHFIDRDSTLSHMFQWLKPRG